MDRQREEQRNRVPWYFALGAGVAVGAAIFFGFKKTTTEEPTEDQASTPSNLILRPSRQWPTKLNTLFDDIYNRYIKIKDDDMVIHYNVFCKVFEQINARMKQVDKYYNKYSARKQFAGSHYGNLRIKKPDEFDYDIVIKLAVDYELNRTNSKTSDIVIKDQSPGFVRLKMGPQFQNMYNRDDFETNKIAYNWMDPNTKYLRRTEFQYWFKSVVDRALLLFDRNWRGEKVLVIDGVTYSIKLSSSGPAVTLIICGEGNFLCEVDLVPALRFPETRWPPCQGYRQIPSHCRSEYWMVVPKPNNRPTVDPATSWRIALQDQEYKMMANNERMKQSIRFLKKLRDTQNMKIASYYINTLFFYELDNNSATSWQCSDSVLFQKMVKKFYEALVEGNIPYYWHQGHNLIEGFHRQVLNQYAKKLETLLTILEKPDSEDKCKAVAKFLLTGDEFKDYDSNFH